MTLKEKAGVYTPPLSDLIDWLMLNRYDLHMWDRDGMQPPQIRICSNGGRVTVVNHTLTRNDMLRGVGPVLTSLIMGIEAYKRNPIVNPERREK